MPRCLTNRHSGTGSTRFPNESELIKGLFLVGLFVVWEQHHGMYDRYYTSIKHGSKGLKYSDIRGSLRPNLEIKTDMSSLEARI